MEKKALGPHGFIIEFFKQFWNISKADIMNLFQNFFHNTVINRVVNAIHTLH